MVGRKECGADSAVEEVPCNGMAMTPGCSGSEFRRARRSRMWLRISPPYINEILVIALNGNFSGIPHAPSTITQIL